MNEVLLRGVPCLKVVYGLAAATTVNLIVPAHEQWVIAWAQGSHDDTGGPRVCGFVLYDGTTTIPIGIGTSIASGVMIPLYQTNPTAAAGGIGCDFALPLCTNEKMTLKFDGVAIGAGKKLRIMALVYVFKGIGDWVEP
jgi:hypothetical protein